MILLKSRSVYFYAFSTIFYSTLFLIISNLEIKLKLKKIFLILIVSYVSFNVTSENIFLKQYKFSENRMNSDVPIYDFVQDLKNKKIPYLNPLLKNKIINKSIEDAYKKVSDPTVSDPTALTVYDFCIRYSSPCRVVDMLYIPPTVSKSSLFGEGIGAGTKTVIVFNKIKRSFYLGELDNKRTIMELGYIVGLFLVVTKILTAIILNFIALFKYRDKNKLIYVPILFFICTQLMIGTVSYSSSFISFIFWFSLGLFFISFNREDRNL
tara:strand:- start:101 stop:901 length:801 start_codon:yes stop_codon:yes gene_type:complete